MSLIRSCLIISAAIMLLPVEEKKQAEFTQTLASTAQRTATYCERNPATCQAGSELWSTFVRKAEYAAELGARLVREQLVRTMTETREAASPAQPSPAPAPAAPAAVLPAAAPPARSAQPQHTSLPEPRRQTYPMDNPSRWRAAADAR